MSIGWEEDSGFLQSGMEPRGGTMGPGTAPPLLISTPVLGGFTAPALFLEPFRRAFRADGAPGWILAASPQLTFSWDSRVCSGRLQSLGEDWAANGLFLERLAGGTRFPARGVAQGQ